MTIPVGGEQPSGEPQPSETLFDTQLKTFVAAVGSQAALDALSQNLVAKLVTVQDVASAALLDKQLDNYLARGKLTHYQFSRASTALHALATDNQLGSSLTKALIASGDALTVDSEAWKRGHEGGDPNKGLNRGDKENFIYTSVGNTFGRRQEARGPFLHGKFAQDLANNGRDFLGDLMLLKDVVPSEILSETAGIPLAIKLADQAYRNLLTQTKGRFTKQATYLNPQAHYSNYFYGENGLLFVMGYVRGTYDRLNQKLKEVYGEEAGQAKVVWDALMHMRDLNYSKDQGAEALMATDRYRVRRREIMTMLLDPERVDEATASFLRFYDQVNAESPSTFTGRVKGQVNYFFGIKYEKPVTAGPDNIDAEIPREDEVLVLDEEKLTTLRRIIPRRVPGHTLTTLKGVQLDSEQAVARTGVPRMATAVQIRRIERHLGPTTTVKINAKAESQPVLDPLPDPVPQVDPAPVEQPVAKPIEEERKLALTKELDLDQAVKFAKTGNVHPARLLVKLGLPIRAAGYVIQALRDDPELDLVKMNYTESKPLLLNIRDTLEYLQMCRSLEASGQEPEPYKAFYEFAAHHAAKYQNRDDAEKVMRAFSNVPRIESNMALQNTIDQLSYIYVNAEVLDEAMAKGYDTAEARELAYDRLLYSVGTLEQKRLELEEIYSTRVFRTFNDELDRFEVRGPNAERFCRAWAVMAMPGLQPVDLRVYGPAERNIWAEMTNVYNDTILQIDRQEKLFRKLDEQGITQIARNFVVRLPNGQYRLVHSIETKPVELQVPLAPQTEIVPIGPTQNSEDVAGTMLYTVHDASVRRLLVYNGLNDEPEAVEIPDLLEQLESYRAKGLLQIDKDDGVLHLIDHVSSIKLHPEYTSFARQIPDILLNTLPTSLVERIESLFSAINPIKNFKGGERELNVSFIRQQAAAISLIELLNPYSPVMRSNTSVKSKFYTADLLRKFVQEQPEHAAALRDQLHDFIGRAAVMAEAARKRLDSIGAARAEAKTILNDNKLDKNVRWWKLVNAFSLLAHIDPATAETRGAGAEALSEALYSLEYGAHVQIVNSPTAEIRPETEFLIFMGKGGAIALNDIGDLSNPEFVQQVRQAMHKQDLPHLHGPLTFPGALGTLAKPRIDTAQVVVLNSPALLKRDETVADYLPHRREPLPISIYQVLWQERPYIINGSQKRPLVEYVNTAGIMTPREGWKDAELFNIGPDLTHQLEHGLRRLEQLPNPDNDLYTYKPQGGDLLETWNQKVEAGQTMTSLPPFLIYLRGVRNIGDLPLRDVFRAVDVNMREIGYDAFLTEDPQRDLELIDRLNAAFNSSKLNGNQFRVLERAGFGGSAISDFTARLQSNLTNWRSFTPPQARLDDAINLVVDNDRSALRQRLDRIDEIYKALPSYLEYDIPGEAANAEIFRMLMLDDLPLYHPHEIKRAIAQIGLVKPGIYATTAKVLIPYPTEREYEEDVKDLGRSLSVLSIEAADIQKMNNSITPISTGAIYPFLDTESGEKVAEVKVLGYTTSVTPKYVKTIERRVAFSARAVETYHSCDVYLAIVPVAVVEFSLPGQFSQVRQIDFDKLGNWFEYKRKVGDNWARLSKFRIDNNQS